MSVFSYVGDRLSEFQKHSHQFFLIKRVFNLVFYKTNIGVLKFKSFLLKLEFNLFIYLFFKQFNAHINHLTQISLINMT
jgi:hypothetical protein